MSPAVPGSPRFSAIIPAYNASATIARSIESVMAQTYPVDEILVIDDGSDDATAQVAESLGPAVRVVRKANGGPGSARNLGARLATGDWLALLDADDAWTPDKLSRQAPFTEGDRVAVVHSQPTQARVPSPASWEAIWARNRVVNSTALVRKTVFDSVGGFSEDRALISVEDYNLWIRIAAAGWDIVWCPGELVDYAPTATSLSRQVERFARAELANVDALIGTIPVTRAQCRSKRLKILEDYGRELLANRDRPAARRLLSEAARQSPSPGRLFWWLATWLPPRVLDARKARRA